VLQKALVAVGAANTYFSRIRSEDNFNHFHEDAVKFVDNRNLNALELRLEADNDFHDLKVELILMSLHHPKHATVKCIMKLVPSLVVNCKSDLVTSTLIL